MMATEADIAWAAGFLEGEGCFFCGKDNALRVVVTQKQKWPLEKMEEIFGGQILSIKKANGREYWQSQWFNSNAVPICQAVLPYLSPRRFGQVKYATGRYYDNMIKQLTRKVSRLQSCPKGHADTGHYTLRPDNANFGAGNVYCKHCSREAATVKRLAKASC